MSRPDVPRSFIAGLDGTVEASHEEHLRHMGVSPGVSAAYDVLADDGMPSDWAARLTVAAERQGLNPEKFARHVRKLRASVREDGGSPTGQSGA